MSAGVMADVIGPTYAEFAKHAGAVGDVILKWADPDNRFVDSPTKVSGRAPGPCLPGPLAHAALQCRLWIAASESTEASL